MASAAPPPEPIRVLLVEDNPVIRELFVVGLRRLRKELGADGQAALQITEVGDGAAALDELAKGPVDLIVVDLYIPVLDGIGLIERIRQDPATAETPVLAVSASIVDARIRAMDAGANDFLQKPLRINDLLEALRNLLGARPV